MAKHRNREVRYGEDPISPMIVKVEENTTLINWMQHATAEDIERAKYSMSKEFEFLNSTGYALDKEQEEYNAINSLWNRVLRLYEKGEYTSAFGGTRISNNKFIDLMKWLQYNNITAVFTAISVVFFAYGLGSLLSYFVFDEPSQNKLRLITKVAIFFFSVLMISLSHPSLKITFAMLIGSRTVNLPLSLVGCFVIGILTYFFVQAGFGAPKNDDGPRPATGRQKPEAQKVPDAADLFDDHDHRFVSHGLREHNREPGNQIRGSMGRHRCVGRHC